MLLTQAVTKYLGLIHIRYKQRLRYYCRPAQFNRILCHEGLWTASQNILSFATKRLLINISSIIKKLTRFKRYLVAQIMKTFA